MHISLDGFTARPNREMDWIKVDEEMFDFAGDRTRESDLALYGRRTYQLMQSYWPTAADNPKATKHDVEHAAWYNRVDKLLISRSWNEPLPYRTWKISDNLIEEVKKLKNDAGKKMVMFGSPSVARLFIQEDLIDEYWLFVNPILLGKGIPLFPELSKSHELTLKFTKSFASGVVCLHYEAKHNITD